MINDFKLDNLRFIIFKKELFEKINAEEFIRNLFIDLGYSVKKINGIVGHPDFIMEMEEEKFYVEVKTNNDGMKADQIEWVKNNPDKRVFCIFLIQKEFNTKIQKTKEKESKEKKINEEFNKKAREVLKTF